MKIRLENKKSSNFWKYNSLEKTTYIVYSNVMCVCSCANLSGNDG